MITIYSTQRQVRKFYDIEQLALLDTIKLKTETIEEAHLAHLQMMEDQPVSNISDESIQDLRELYTKMGYLDNIIDIYIEGIKKSPETFVEALEKIITSEEMFTKAYIATNPNKIIEQTDQEHKQQLEKEERERIEKENDTEEGLNLGQKFRKAITSLRELLWHKIV
jgi:hypothetical protein